MHNYACVCACLCNMNTLSSSLLLLLSPPLSLLVQPGFYVVNWLLLGKTLLALREKERAKEWLTKASQLESSLEEDLEVCDK